MQSKRKDISPPASAPALKKQELCILHVPNIKHGPFTAFADLQDSEERLSKLKTIRDRRLAEHTAPLRMAEVCQRIPEEIQGHHGYHRACYQKFTKNLDRLVPPEERPSSSSSHRHSSRKKSVENIIFEPDCIFCNKVGKIHVTRAGVRTTQGTASFERDGWQRVY